MYYINIYVCINKLIYEHSQDSKQISDHFLEHQISPRVDVSENMKMIEFDLLYRLKRCELVLHVRLHISRRIARRGIWCSKKVIQRIHVIKKTTKKFFRFQYLKTLPITFNMAFLKICFASWQCSIILHVWIIIIYIYYKYKIL